VGQVLFVLKQKGPKNSSQQKCFFALEASALQNEQNRGWNYFAPERLVPRTCKNFLCPAAAQARIVLSVFARSRSADGFGDNEGFGVLAKS
jgi:hypothetical protein